MPVVLVDHLDRRPHHEFYNDLPAEERMNAMREELDLVDAQLRRAVAELEARERNVNDGASRMVGRVRVQRAKVEELDKRANELHAPCGRHGDH